MPLDFTTVAAGCVGATAVGAALGMAVQAGRKAYKAEAAVVETLPRLQKELERHTADDESRFDSMNRTLSRIEQKIDLGMNDISWLKGERGGSK